MPEPQSTIITALLEHLITTGSESLGQVFTALFDLAMRSQLCFGGRTASLVLRFDGA